MNLLKDVMWQDNKKKGRNYKGLKELIAESVNQGRVLEKGSQALEDISVLKNCTQMV